MKRTKGKLKILAGVLASLLVFSVAANVYYWDKNKDLVQERNNIEQQANSLLSAQNQDINRLKEEAELIEEKNNSLSEEVVQLNTLLTQANADVWELRTKGATSTENLELIRSTSKAQLADLQIKATQLSDENGSLLSQNDLMRQELALLQDSLQVLMESTLTADGFRMVAFKKNNKETAKAKKVDRLTVSLDIPPVFGLQSREMLYLSLTDMQGNGVIDPLQILTISTPEEDMVIPVHDTKIADFSGSHTKQQVTFYVYRTEGIQPGRYRASVYTKDRYLGSVELQFRDSFWFF